MQRLLDDEDDSLDSIHPQHLVAVVVDDFDGDLAGGGRVEGAALSGVEVGPGGFVNLGAARALELLVGPVAAKKRSSG